jgi:hypothetical protein
MRWDGEALWLVGGEAGALLNGQGSPAVDLLEAGRSCSIDVLSGILERVWRRSIKTQVDPSS